MRKLTYFAVFEPSKSGGYGVYFPDLPGCVSYGESYDKAVSMAEEALRLRIYGMEQDGDDIPVSNTLEKLEVNEETAGGYIISPIAIFPEAVKNELDNHAVKTNLTIPAWLKELAEERKVNYSQLLTTALKEYLNV